MWDRSSSLIVEIERDALNTSVPVSTPLRKLMALGGQAGSSDLREWASLELRGYVGKDVPLPDYRRVGALIRIDGATINSRITGQLISPAQLPDPANKHIHESVPLNAGVAEIEAMIERAKRDEGGELKLSLPGGQAIVGVMNAEMRQRGDDYQTITAVYWSVSHIVLEGVIDQIRTRLVELVAEMRAAMPGEADVPSASVADNAVSIVIHGGSPRVSVASAQASGTGSHTVTTATEPNTRGTWTRVGGFVVGAAIVLGTLVTIALWQDWNPF